MLNASRFPPEVLGDIFRRNVTFDGAFGGPEGRSHNFLLVCHHWFQVALHTPGVWTSWGNNLWDWEKQHYRYPTAPLNLVLAARWPEEDVPSDSLLNSLRDRASRDNIQCIHLSSVDPPLLGSILAQLNADCDGIRTSSVESVVVYDEGDYPSTDVSKYFTHHHFPKLRRLELHQCDITSWDTITLQAPLLTTLTLVLNKSSHTPTTSQLISILCSSPALREITLYTGAIPDDAGIESRPRVPLNSLKKLELLGGVRDVFGLLRQLDHPATMDRLTINVSDCTVWDISKTIGSYLREYLRRRGKSSGLGVYLHSRDHISLNISDVGSIGYHSPRPTSEDVFVEVDIWPGRGFPRDLLQGVSLDLTTNIPREEILYFGVHLISIPAGAVFARFPRLRVLHFKRTPLHTTFPNPTSDRDGEVLPSLQHVILDHMAVPNDDWSPLTVFLTHHAAGGNQLGTLEVVEPEKISTLVRTNTCKIGPGAKESIRRVVGELKVTTVD